MHNAIAGDFGVTRIAGEGGRLIRIGQWLLGDGYRNFEHAFIYLGGGQCLEAEPTGARIHDLSEYPPAYTLVSDYVLTTAQRQAIVSTTRKMVGTPYSWLDYFALAAKRFHVPSKRLDAYIASTGHMMCSQLVDTVYLRVGVHLFDDGRSPGDVTPADLAELIS